MRLKGVKLKVEMKLEDRGLGKAGIRNLGRFGVRGLAGDTGPERTRRLEGSRGAKRFLKIPIFTFVGTLCVLCNFNRLKWNREKDINECKCLKACGIQQDRLLDEKIFVEAKLARVIGIHSQRRLTVETAEMDSSKGKAA